MTEPSSPPPEYGAECAGPLDAAPSYRPTLYVALAATAGIALGSLAPWVDVTFIGSLSGVDFEGWGTMALIHAVIAGTALSAQLFWARMAFNQQWAVPVAWAVVVAAAACLTSSVINILRVMTVKPSEFLAVTVGVSVGWGLWLVAFCSVVLAVAAPMLAVQIAKCAETAAGPGPEPPGATAGRGREWSRPR